MGDYLFWSELGLNPHTVRLSEKTNHRSPQRRQASLQSVSRKQSRHRQSPSPSDYLISVKMGHSHGLRSGTRVCCVLFHCSVRNRCVTNMRILYFVVCLLPRLQEARRYPSFHLYESLPVWNDRLLSGLDLRDLDLTPGIGLVTSWISKSTEQFNRGQY